jgi:hypothetical protein
MNTDNNTIGRVRALISIGGHLGSHAGTEEQPRTRALPEDQLRELNSRMDAKAKSLRWSSFLKNAQNLPLILAQALACASTELQSTSLRDRVIAPASVPNEPALEARLNGEQKSEWMALLKKALRQKDWEPLITHCLSHLPLLSFFFNANSFPSSDLTSRFVTGIAICAPPSSAKSVESRGST